MSEPCFDRISTGTPGRRWRNEIPRIAVPKRHGQCRPGDGRKKEQLGAGKERNEHLEYPLFGGECAGISGHLNWFGGLANRCPRELRRRDRYQRECQRPGEGTDLPDVSSPPCKNISLKASGKSRLQLRPSRPEEGRWPSSRTLGGMRWTQQRRKTSDSDADGEVVWS